VLTVTPLPCSVVTALSEAEDRGALSSNCRSIRFSVIQVVTADKLIKIVSTSPVVRPSPKRQYRMVVDHAEAPGVTVLVAPLQRKYVKPAGKSDRFPVMALLPVQIKYSKPAGKSDRFPLTVLLP
jgi:hypothetical protein